MLRETPHSLESLLLAAPIVFLLVLLFNAYRLGAFSKSKHPAKKAGLMRTWRNQAVCIGVIALILIMCFLLRSTLSI